MALARRNRMLKRVEERESGWDLSSSRTCKLPEYNALFDPNMRHYFENRVIQKHLHTTGQVKNRFFGIYRSFICRRRYDIE